MAGADPLQAIRYQIIVMFMLVGSTTIGTLLVVGLPGAKNVRRIG